MLRFVYFVLTVLAFNKITWGEELEDGDKLKVKLYYEALCPDCINFITTQLYPSMITKERLKNAELNLVPYGNARIIFNQTSNEKEIDCQHGLKECQLNALHACLIENTNIEESLNIINCLMKNKGLTIDECATHFKVDIKNVKKCFQSQSIYDILKPYADETEKIHIEFVPSIAVDDVFDIDEQNELASKFDEAFCQKFYDKFKYKLDDCPETLEESNVELRIPHVILVHLKLKK